MSIIPALATAARKTLSAAFLASAIALASGAPPVFAQSKALVVDAAASLKNALDEVNAAFGKEKAVKVVTSYAASSALAKQIESGSPADVFISADLDWMDYLAGKKLIKPETRANLLGNKIVLVAAASSTIKVDVAPNFPLDKLLGDGRLAMADPNAVPAGKYGKASLEALGVWASVATKVAPAENVRAALLFVSRGETPLGIVYQTDAAADRGVKVVGTFPDDSHPPIVYPVAVTANSGNPAAAAYVVYLRSSTAVAAFEKQGFTMLK